MNALAEYDIFELPIEINIGVGVEVNLIGIVPQWFTYADVHIDDLS